MTDALRCFWKGGAYSRIREVRVPQFDNTPEKRVADFMDGDRGASSCCDLLQYLAEEVRGARREKILSDDQYTEICAQLVNSLVKASGESSTSFWSHVYTGIQSLTQSGLQFRTTQDIGEIAFRAEKYDEAIEAWKE